jgi:hypothetical protein
VKKILYLHHYIYFRLYIVLMLGYGERGFNTSNNFSACINLTITYWTTLLTLFLVMDQIVYLHIPDILVFTIASGVVSLVVLNWLYFWWGDRYIRILKEFDLETELQKPKAWLPGVACISTPLLTFFALLIYYETTK